MGCGEGEPSPTSAGKAAAAPIVFASNAPLAWMVRELAGGAVGVITPWSSQDGEGEDWSPTDAEIRLLQGASLIVLNGADFEPWAGRVAIARTLLLDTTAACEAVLIKQDGIEHAHGPRGAHSHSGFASTTWLSPILYAEQADAIARRLARLVPADAQAISGRLARVQERLRALDRELKESAKQAPQWLASHPVYQYLAASAGASISAVHWEPADLPSAAQWAELEAARATIDRERVPMLWEGEPLPEVREHLEQLGIVVVVYPPFGQRNGDFLQSCETAAAKLRASTAESVGKPK